MLRKLIILTVFILLYTHTSAHIQNFLQDTKSEPGRNLISPTLLIPGIEQIKNKKYLKGTLFLACFTATITGALINNHKGYDFYNQYLESRDVQEIACLRENSETAFKRWNLFLISAFSIWFFHLIDLKIFKKGGTIKSEVNLAHNGFSCCIYF